MVEIKSGKNYMAKRSKNAKMTNIPLGNTGHESSGVLQSVREGAEQAAKGQTKSRGSFSNNKLTKNGQVYKNDLLQTDFTDQVLGTRKKHRSR